MNKLVGIGINFADLDSLQTLEHLINMALTCQEMEEEDSEGSDFKRIETKVTVLNL